MDTGYAPHTLNQFRKLACYFNLIEIPLNLDVDSFQILLKLTDRSELHVGNFTQRYGLDRWADAVGADLAG